MSRYAELSHKNEKKKITPNILTKPRNMSSAYITTMLVYISNNPAFSTYRYRNNYKINPCETTSNKTRVSPKHKARVNANMRLVLVQESVALK